MNNNRKTSLVFLLIAIQSALAITAGVIALLTVSKDRVPPGITSDGLSIGSMSYSQAAENIDAAYSRKFNSKNLVLKIEGGNTFEIPFSQIEAAADSSEAFTSLRGVNGPADIPRLLALYFCSTGLDIKPAIKFNESKLRMALVELSDQVYIDPVDAKMSYTDGTVMKRADTPGLSLNVANAVEVIRRQLSAAPWEAVTLDGSDNYVLQSVNASVTMEDFGEIQQVLAEYTTHVKDEELAESILFASDAINGVTLPAASEGGDPSEFSFVECLKNKNADFENDNEGYDQVASTLYAALLKAGINGDTITRLPHKLAADYIEPGLDAWISGNAGDLKFTNPFDRKIAIFAVMDADMLTVAVAGSGQASEVKYELTTEIVQRFSPPVYYVENESLKQGEKIVLNPGKEGILINVYRNGELISTDQYEAEKAIVQIAPGSEWNGESK